MNELLHIEHTNNDSGQSEIDLTDAKDIFNFFTSYMCPICHKNILEGNNLRTHYLSYFIPNPTDDQKEGHLNFKEFFPYFDPSYIDEITEDFQSAELDYQFIAYMTLKHKYIPAILFDDVSQELERTSCFNPDTKTIYISSFDVEALYHELGHVIFDRFRDKLFISFIEAISIEFIPETKKKIDDYFDETFKVKKVLTKTSEEMLLFGKTLKIEDKEKKEFELQRLGYPNSDKNTGLSLLASSTFYLVTRYSHIIDVSSALRKDDNDCTIIGTPGHSFEYWQIPEHKEHELFADMFCEYASGRNDVIDLFKKFLPKCVEEYEKIIEILLNQPDIWD